MKKTFSPIGFLKQFFGGDREHACLTVTDRRLEVAMLNSDKNKPVLSGLNRLDLNDGVIKKGSVVQETAFHEAVTKLFETALPKPIHASRLFVAVPFDQLFPFLRVFHSRLAEDHLRMEMREFIQTRCPLPLDEMEIAYEQVQRRGSEFPSGALGIPIGWQNSIQRAVGESGFKEFHFIPETRVQQVLSGVTSMGDSVLVTHRNGLIFLSIFFGGLLFDSFCLEEMLDANTLDECISALSKEIKKASIHYGHLFKIRPSVLYFSGFDEKTRVELKGMVENEAEIVFLEETETPFLKQIPPADYSGTLRGLVKISLES